ncbi:hypothetical protein ADINL_0487 [Nitrincola lacisaponensis]|uniref:Uncharacterized protein n=1 Tax=Nitrincola lacisaponensis TaxID=267850 RepID=A0A063Y3E9_9GAMM|nr:hypothetical protein ADINL_0487 [Nitrincola lacisaponensis]
MPLALVIFKSTLSINWVALIAGSEQQSLILVLGDSGTADAGDGG